MKPAIEFTQPISPIAGEYPESFPGYVFLQPLGGGRTGVHVGTDYNGPGGGNTDLGFDIFSVANGIVEKLIRWDGKSVGYGNHLFIRHQLSPYLEQKYGAKVIYAHYAHLEAFRCFEGQEVSKGQVIAKLGNTGTQYAHLHLEIRKPTGRCYNDYPSTQPLDWLRKYYFDCYPFIEENRKEPQNETSPPNTSPITSGTGEGTTVGETPTEFILNNNNPTVGGDTGNSSSGPDIMQPPAPDNGESVVPEPVIPLPQPPSPQEIQFDALVKFFKEVWQRVKTFFLRAL